MFCLVLAFACLIAAAATLSAQPVPGAVTAARAGVSRPSVSPVVALSVVLFLLVVGALLRRERTRPTPSAVRRPHPR